MQNNMRTAESHKVVFLLSSIHSCETSIYNIKLYGYLPSIIFVFHHENNPLDSVHSECFHISNFV